MKPAVITILLAVAACTPAAKDNGVYAVAVALTAADNTALRYVTLPLCGAAHPKPMCSEADVTAKIKTAAQAAHDAVKAAETNPGALGAAEAAVQALVSVTPKTGA
jgi:hypothetical protein